MKTKTIALLTAATLLPLAGFAQTPPAPPVPPTPPSGPAAPLPPVMPGGHHRAPKGPVTFLGVETSEVPSVVCDQLGLAKGFGLVVDYVVPDGPAAAAGVQQNDILKTLNDQILTEPDQLAKLIRSFSEGTTVTLTVLRKGAEQKLTVKLAKHEVSSENHMFGPGMHGFGHDWKPDVDFGEMKERMRDLHEQLKGMGGQNGLIREVVEKARVTAGDEIRRAADDVRQAADEARRRSREIRVVTSGDGGVKTTRIDLGKAQILFRDSAGEMKIENVDGKKVLTAKDPEGKLLFSGPVETKEDLDKLPPEVRARYDRLEQKDLSTVNVPQVTGETEGDERDDESADAEGVEQVSLKAGVGTALTSRSVLL